jgi:predicted sulfurtransferase
VPLLSSSSSTATATASTRNQKEGGGPQWLDPKMRKSTDFKGWLDKESTKEELKNKTVLLYCTGGIRCEKATNACR